MKKILLTLALLMAWGGNKASAQLYNLSLDAWSKEGRVWSPNAADAPSKTWDSGNKGTIVLGKNVTEPEEDFVAVKGPGKRAARLRSEFIGVAGIGKFASACLYTGRFLKVVGMKGAQMSFGLPYSQRPASLHGYYAYKPGKIDYASKEHASKKGTTDHGHIEIYLTSWSEPFVLDNAQNIGLDPKAPYVIGYGVLELDKPTGGYVEFDIPVVYVSDKTPTYIGIMAASSKWGDSYTGSTDSILYLDELEIR
jgi:hypothetical protein